MALERSWFHLIRRRDARQQKQELLLVLGAGWQLWERLAKAQMSSTEDDEDWDENDDKALPAFGFLFENGRQRDWLSVLKR
ncbi:Hypothetical protein NTJ_09686 [Nesidiocoris tenuis]|nr:Hypothetical protein NTJ_09686 [Nesidiocoris tenuis]